MHSRNNSVENISDMNSSQVQKPTRQREFKCDDPSASFQGARQSWPKESRDNMDTVPQKHKSSYGSQPHNRNSQMTKQTSCENSRDLSHDDLLLLLSILEGELQAKDEFITVLRAEKIDLALLEAHYGFVAPTYVLQALQRDTIQTKGHGWQEDIYKKPISELDKLVEKQKETYRRMLDQLLMVEQAHKQTLSKLEDEKRNHNKYMKKRDEFTSLLDQERERLKLLNDQEKAYHEQKEEENNRKVMNLKDELTKLKTFALLVVDEQEHVTEQLAQQSAKVQKLQATAVAAQEELISAQTRAQTMESKVLHLEAELHDQAVQFHQEQEAMHSKLTYESSQNEHLRWKLSTLCQDLDQLEELNKALHRAEEELHELRNKNINGESGNAILETEVEELRKRVLEMEEKDEELIKMEDMCRDLKRNLEKESIQNHSLIADVDNLSYRITELEKLEDDFGKCKEEHRLLKCNLDNERTVTKHMSNELDNLRVRVKELEAAEGLLHKTEWTLKEDLTKLKTLTVILVDEKKTMAEKLKQLENKVQHSTDKLQVEQDKVTLITEKLVEESKKVLVMEEKICIATKETDDLKTKLKLEDEKNHALQFKVSMMKKRLQSLEAIEKEFLRNKAKQENMKGPTQNCFQQEDNKLKDLTQEVEWISWEIREMNVFKNDLLKTHSEGESLKKQYSSEKHMVEELEIARKDLSKYQLGEKENFNQEHILYKLLKEEEVKSSHLTKEVDALKEKVHSYMGTEESICNMKTEYATLQRKLAQQEVRGKELAREKETLTKELERYRHFSKSLRPGMIGRRFSDLQFFTKEVQTDPSSNLLPTSKTLNLLEEAVVNGKLYEESNQQYDPSSNETNPATCTLSLKNNNSLQNKTKQIRNPVFKNIEKQQLINCEIQTGTCQQEDVLVNHNPSQHPHIKLTQDPSHNIATYEIKSPTTDNPQSYTTTAVIPTSVCTTNQLITIIPNAPVSPQNNKSHPSIESPSAHEESVIPLSTTSYFQADIKADHTVFCVTSQRQNNWHVHRYTNSSPNVTNEDNKTDINQGIPYTQTINSNTETPRPCYSPGLEQGTSVLTSTTSAKVNSKTTSSIRIKPFSTPVSQPTQITVPIEAFQQSGPTRIPKPKGTNASAALTQSTGPAQALPKLGKAYTVT